MHPWKTEEGLTIGDWDESSDDYYHNLSTEAMNAPSAFL